MTNTIQVRRGANADLPTLSAGEIGFSTDTKQLHIGDGTTNHEIAMLANVLKNIVEDTTPQLGGALDCNSHQVGWSKGADVASASTLTLGTDGNYFDITGTTTITSIGSLGIGTVVMLHFDGILTLTHNATDLILPGGVDITTTSGDEAIFVEYASGDWRCVAYTKASGKAVARDTVVKKTATYTATADDDTILCDATSGAMTINLPTAVGISGKKYNIKKIDSSANNVTIDPNGTETIDGASTLAISGQYDSYTVQSDNANWWII